MADTAQGASPFRITDGREKGYDREQVDDFLARARSVFEGAADESTLTSQEVRSVSFPLRRHGYDVAGVDAALARIEDAFAARERQSGIHDLGAHAWVEQARDDAQALLDRVQRPEGMRFDRVGWMHYGYDPRQVDVVADRVRDYLAAGASVTVEQIRQSAFRMVRGGYRETQVDAALDAVIDVMLAVR
ncbi:MAG: DivIVA domain-containing protein [Microbacterium sp.]